ncbi:L-lactate permease [Bacillus pseudomycoides]|uniref:L-lactate permease n=1 Tax=Bacillus pseudomycoides TaxID=64104 RepID=A0A2A8B5P0_9BACI|nr:MULTISPECIES: lactate permease LctP family transporter [Bacillus]AIK36949.1 transporter, lactate permease family protein [Bacillus pseudomycoides]AJI17738.1 transporter, lactate permease family protein [Bacillus pseudomycoides]EEM12696.1 L-lactate permease [Bacillus pseudomycoides]EEM18487.1 L-lactate permease [Bacillus pseudomycoides DSM 12442]KFN13482.1 transporter, lactate permease family protein [Bacillus pseudomycoides]
MNTWTQIYDPLNNIWLSALVAALPILFFVLCLTVFKIKGYLSGLYSVILAIILSIFVYKMPATMAVSSAAFGVAAGFYPICTIVIAAIFLYKLTVKTEQFNVIRDSISSITNDRRLQVLLIAYSFGAFLEGAAGFGVPVAITAALLVGMGFNPLKAAGICLVANIAGGAMGAMGIPVTVPAQLTQIDALTVGRQTVTLLPFISFVLPFLLVAMVDGFKGIKETWQGILVSGGSFAITQFVVTYYLGAELTDIFAAVVSMVALALFLRVWQPKSSAQTEEQVEKHSYTMKQILYAWSPFAFLTAFVTIFNLKAIKSLFAPNGALANLVFNIQIPGLHNHVIKTTPIVNADTPFAAIFKLDVFSSTTTAIVLAIIVSLLVYRAKGQLVKELTIETLKELKAPIYTICSVIALAYVTNYSGMSSTLGLALSSTGKAFPILSPILGWIGVFLTGSVVSSGSLFAPLQAVTAAQLDIVPSTLVALNVVGGTMAKMVSPQSVAVACAAVGLVGKESVLFKTAMKYSLIFLVIISLLQLNSIFNIF